MNKMNMLGFISTFAPVLPALAGATIIPESKYRILIGLVAFPWLTALIAPAIPSNAALALPPLTAVAGTALLVAMERRPALLAARPIFVIIAIIGFCIPAVPLWVAIDTARIMSLDRYCAVDAFEQGTCVLSPFAWADFVLSAWVNLTMFVSVPVLMCWEMRIARAGGKIKAAG